MICPGCQSYVNDHSRFCTRCGADLYGYKSVASMEATDPAEYRPEAVQAEAFASPASGHARKADAFAKTSVKKPPASRRKIFAKAWIFSMVLFLLISIVRAIVNALT